MSTVMREPQRVGPDHEPRRHLGRFIVVGLLSVGTDAALYLTMVSVGLPRDASKGIGYVAGMAIGFALNKTWTFGSRRAASSEALTYVLLYAVTLGVNIGLNRLVLAMGMERLMPVMLAILAFVVATGTTTILNFLGMRFIIFRRGIAELKSTQCLTTTK